MNVKIYDENLLRNDKATEDTVDWYEMPCKMFDIYGMLPENGGLLTRRMPLEIAKKVSRGVAGQSGYGAGGRIRFSTDSSFVALKIVYGEGAVPTVCNHCFSYGFDLYKFDNNKKDVFVGAYRPAADFDFHTAEYNVETKNNGEMTCYTLNMPHFSEVKKIYIGLEKGCKLGKNKKYRNDKPIVFYGSSITHGAAAGRPGNTYENFISQKYNIDYINLGFAGNAKGEADMAEYISGLEMCAFVCDYDHNAPDVKHLMDTHYPFYEVIRKSHPDIPYIMISKPDFHADPTTNDKRRNIIIESYNKAIASGDKNVYFIDGETLFEGDFYKSCTSDGCHPNDLGFYRMANKIGEVIAQLFDID